jgi:hypothetical protein
VDALRIRLTLGFGCLTFLIALAATPRALAQGSIFGAVSNSDASTPADGEISFFGFLDDTDEEIRLVTSDGAGYDAGNWFDDFQNYLTEVAGNPYDYFFYNRINGEGFHLAELIPDNSFQQEDIQLAPVSWPPAPTNLTTEVLSSTEILVSWNGSLGLTYHVYRRDASSNGSLFRLDNPAGDLSDPGISETSFTDTTVDGVSEYEYLVIAEDASGNYSSLPSPFVCGNVDGSGEDPPIDIDDAVFLLVYIFADGPAPDPLESGDADCSGFVDIDDVVYILTYVFIDGPAPCDPDGDEVPDC